MLMRVIVSIVGLVILASPAWARGSGSAHTGTAAILLVVVGYWAGVWGLALVGELMRRGVGYLSWLAIFVRRVWQ